MKRRCAALVLPVFAYALIGNASGQQSPEETVRAAITRYVMTAAKCSAQEIAVGCGTIQGPLRDSIAMADTVCVHPVDGAAALSGKKVFVVETRRGGVVIGRGQVLATIRRFAEVVVTRRRIDRGELLSLADVGLEWREIKTTHGTPLLSVSQVLGKRTRHILSRDQMVRAEDVELPPVVRRGDVVTLLVDAKNITVSVKVQALQDGVCGQRIQVRALDSSTRYMAEVKEQGLVVLRP